MNKNCLLCNESSKLVKSHIQPSALHKDELKLDSSGEPIKIFRDNQSYGKRSLTGLYDEIVCKSCEDRFKEWDDYGIDFVRKYRDGKNGKLVGSSSDPIAFLVDDFDYKKLKLFVLSMLWRADACSLKEYSRVDLGGKWRSDLTNAILISEPGEPNYFAITASLYKNENEKRVIPLPFLEKHRVKGKSNVVNHIRFYVYGGFTFLIKVDQQCSPFKTSGLILSDGSPFIVAFRNHSPSEAKVIKKIIRENPKF